MIKNKKVIIIVLMILFVILFVFVIKNDFFSKKTTIDVNNEIFNEFSEDFSYLEENDNGIIVAQITGRISSETPEYLFKIYGYKNEDNFSYSANRIVILDKDDNSEKIIQEITFGDTQTYDSVSLGFVMEDMNFDGFNDIRIQSFVPAGPNTPYYYWLWDKDSFKYVRNNDLEKITAPEFDNENELVISYIRISAVEYWIHKYKYENDTLILVEEEKIIY